MGSEMSWGCPPIQPYAAAQSVVRGTKKAPDAGSGASRRIAAPWVVSAITGPAVKGPLDAIRRRRHTNDLESSPTGRGETRATAICPDDVKVSVVVSRDGHHLVKRLLRGFVFTLAYVSHSHRETRHVHSNP